MKKLLLRNARRKILPVLLTIVMIAQSATGSQIAYADENVYLEINGYQISTILEAFRTVYSVSDPDGRTEEIGLIYGLTDLISNSDMKIGSSNEVVHAYTATPLGASNVSYSSLKDAKTYVRTMEFVKTVSFYDSSISVRAYAKLKDGTYVYSDISTVSVYKIANALYKNSLMTTNSGHNYLYENILSVVNPEYESIEYSYKNILVPVETSTTKNVEITAEAETTSEAATTKEDITEIPSTVETTTEKITEKVTEEITTEKITEAPTTVETTTSMPEETTTEPPKNIVLDSYFDGIDTDSSSTVGSGSETSDKLFDGNVNTKMYTGDAPPVRIAWKMKQAVVLKKYTLTTANDSATYSYRTPVAWHLYGSNNATSWTQIDTVTDGEMAAQNYASYTYETDVQDSFQYFMLMIDNNAGYYYGIQLAEISMYGDVAAASDDIGEELQKYYDAVDTSNTNTNGYNSEVPSNLFDGDTSTKMFTSATSAVTIGWKEKQAVTVYSYSLTTANDNATYKGRNPRAWVLYGSTDGNNWETIDTVTDSGIENVNYKTYTYTVDNVGTYQYFKLNVTKCDSSNFQLSEISLKGNSVSPCKYDILFTGDWDLITSQGYVDELVKLFYNSYPRLYARWGDGSEPTTITFKADSTYDGVAYCQGTTVCVSTTYANNNPNDIGFFSHEITHSVQQYNGKLNYGDDVAWWTENMANYGGFRYFHWSNPKYVQIYEASDTSLQDWGYEQYGNNKWFFAYMDYKYPTTKDASGNIKYGLIDSINKLIKDNSTGSAYTDDPYLSGSPFNNVVKEITGYDTIEELRLKYVEELQNGTWTFTGFADYSDNWITEDIEGVDNPDYPTIQEKTHGTNTASQLSSAVTSGTNLCSTASVYDCSGYTNANESPEKLIDGNLSTKWCATTSSVTNPTYKLSGVAHWIMLDLGEEKEFNTYTLYNTQTKEGYGNMTEWEVLTSNDAKTWTSVDYQPSNNSSIASFNVGSQKARYIFLKVFTPDDGTGTLRLYEFQLYNK